MTRLRLVKEGHGVQMGYQISGNFGDFEHDAMSFANLVTEFAKYFKLKNAPRTEEKEKLV